MAILRARDKDGNIIDIPTIKGDPGKSAYDYAKEGGYTGTESDFNNALANIGTGGSGSADPDIVSRIDTLEMKTYPIAFTGVTLYPSTDLGGPKLPEKGETVTSVTVYYHLNKKPYSLSFDNESVDPTINGNVTIQGLCLTHAASESERSFWLTAEDDLFDDDEAVPISTSTSVTVEFSNRIYYGTAALPETYSSDFVESLDYTCSTQQLDSAYYTPEDSEHYMFYCCPSAFAKPVFKFNNLCGGFSLVATIEVTNSIGYTEEYHIYRSNNPGLGKTKVDIETPNIWF